MSSAKVLLALPVLNECLDYLDARSLAVVARVCRRLRDASEVTAAYVLRRLAPVVSPDGRQLEEGAALAAATERFSYVAHLHRTTMKRIILVGGGSMDEGQESYKRSDHLDVATGAWTPCAPMQKKRGTFKTEAVAVGNYAVAVSGDDEAAVGTLEAYMPLTDAWVDLPPLPEKLMLVAAAAVGHTLYIIGGIDKATGLYTGAVHVLHMGHGHGPGGGATWGTWSVLPARLLKPRVGHASTSLNGQLWVAGGQFSGADAEVGSPEYVTSRHVEYYDAAAQRWQVGPPMTAERIWFRLLVVRGALYAVGGDVDGTGKSLIPTIERLDAVSNRWEKVGEFREVRRVFSTSAVDTKIYVFGGRDVNYGTLQDWDCFDCVTCEWESARYEGVASGPSSAATARSPSDDEKKKADKLRSCDSADSLMTLLARAPEARLIPRSKFYGGQAISLPAEDVHW